MFDLLDQLLDATVVIDEKANMQFFNVAAEKKFGYKKQEVTQNQDFYTSKRGSITNGFLDTNFSHSKPSDMFR